MSAVGKLLDYGTPAGWIGLAGNKTIGTPRLGEGYDALSDELSGKKGLDTAAQGARDAQVQAQALAKLQWERQMQGLGEARGQTQPYLSLYDKIYGTQNAGHQTPVGGAGGPGVGGGPPPYNQAQTPRMVGPGRFLPAGRVAGDAAIQQHLGGNPTPGGPGYAGLANGNGANQFAGAPQDNGMQLQKLLADMLGRRMG